MTLSHSVRYFSMQTLCAFQSDTPFAPRPQHNCRTRFLPQRSREVYAFLAAVSRSICRNAAEENPLATVVQPAGE